MASVVADSDATIVITHSTAPPRQQLPEPPRFADIGREVVDFLRERVDRALAAGIPESGSSSTRGTTSTRTPCTRSS